MAWTGGPRRARPFPTMFTEEADVLKTLGVAACLLFNVPRGVWGGM